MKIRNIIYSVLSAAMLVFTGCEAEPNESKDTIQFTVRYSELSYNYAIINVKHNGPEDVTWYGFLTEDVTKTDFEIFYSEYGKLIKEDKIEGLKKETERNILLEDLKEGTHYRYIVFGISEDGVINENAGIGSIKFKTETNIYKMRKTNDWTITHLGRNEDKTKELIEVKSNKGGRFAWQYITKESVDEFNKEYPNGFELWDNDIYMATVDAIELFALEQISTIQYYMAAGGYKLSELTYIYEADKPFELKRLASGEYYIIVYGFQGDGQHTQTYSVQKITIEEEPATPEYEKWLGTYTFSGEALVTKDNGDEVLETRNYNIKIEHFDNNYMYRIHGWECGDDVKYDWEEDIMQLDKSKNEYLAFPAYYNEGKLEIRESPMTYITFDGYQSLVLGIYGYAYNKEMDEEIPVILDDTPMASAEPIAEGETVTILNGMPAEYVDINNKKTEWEYCKMGYIAWNENSGAWQTINPPMRFPITITKVSDEDSGESSMEINQNSGMDLFATKKISTDFLKKDFSKLEKMKPEIFERQF